ncbi:hypothetical protein DM860_009328 [Cuscuta australis]|uniref:SAP domain-containing protein n=1 Tax=Cuscuta australis TaxID=267555 RepID=A0A328DF18_9ASTE|nr:hypothetical protein DM860_009328 [Cuscuta australis]
MADSGSGFPSPSSNFKGVTATPQPRGGGEASKYLSNLPSRGLFSSAVPSSSPGGMQVYVCVRDTMPPENQIIKTDQMNILIRSLTLDQHRGVSGLKDRRSTANDSSRKRAAGRALDGRASAKKAASSSQAISCQEGTKNHVPDRHFQSLTVERLRALLKEKGLSPRGRKDELVARLNESSHE